MKRRTQNFKNDRNIRRSKRALEQLKALQKGEVLPRHSQIQITSPKIIEDDTVIQVVPRTPSPIRPSALKNRIPSPVKKQLSTENHESQKLSTKIRLPSPPLRKRKKGLKNTPKMEDVPEPEVLRESIIDHRIEVIPEIQKPKSIRSGKIRIPSPNPAPTKPLRSKISIPSPESFRRS